MKARNPSIIVGQPILAAAAFQAAFPKRAQIIRILRNAVLLCAAMTVPLSTQPTAHDILAASRAALGGSKVASMQSISVWGPDKRGGQSGEVALSLDLTGKFLREQTSLANGGEITKMGMGEEGAGSTGGGMPGDDGGPALGL